MTTDILQPKNGLVVYKNAHATIRVTVTNSDGKPTDLTGARLIFTVKENTTTERLVFQKTSDSPTQVTFTSPATGGVAEVYLLPVDTKGLTVRTYVFDVWLVKGGKQFPIITPSDFDLKPGVTVI